MKGKTLRVIELEKKIEEKEHMLDVYAVFKDLKYGNVYTIYKDYNDITSDVLHYASSHFKQSTLVVLDVKEKGKVEELVKELVWNILNNVNSNDFEMLDLKDIDRVEIIGSNTLKVKDEVLSTLKKLCIPKVKQTNDEQKTKSSAWILALGFTIAIGIASYFVITHKEEFKPETFNLICTKEYEDDELNAKVDYNDTLIFNTNYELVERNIIMLYTFNSTDSYNEYKRLGLYYKINPVSSSSKMEYIDDDINNIFTIKESVTTEKEYFEATEYSEVVERMNFNNYKCVVSE